MEWRYDRRRWPELAPPSTLTDDELDFLVGLPPFNEPPYRLAPREPEVDVSPAKSAKQQKFFGADLARAEKGQKTRTGMSESTLKEMAEKPKGGYKKGGKK